MPDPDEVPPQGPPEEAAVAAVDEPQPAGRPVSEESAELYFLIANFLTNASPCSRAAAVLQQELVCETRPLLRHVSEDATRTFVCLSISWIRAR